MMVVIAVELARPVRHPGRRGKGVVGESLLGPAHPPVDDHQDEEQDEHEEDAADEAGKLHHEKACEELLVSLEGGCADCDSHMEAFQKLLDKAPQ